MKKVSKIVKKKADIDPKLVEACRPSDAPDVVDAMRSLYADTDGAVALPLEALNSNQRFLEIVKSLGGTFLTSLELKVFKRYKILARDVRAALNNIEARTSELSQDFMFNEMSKHVNILKSIEQFCKIQPVYFDDAKNWWFWNHQKFMWARVDETDLMNSLDSAIKHPTANAQIKNEVVEALRRIGRKNKPKDAKESWIQFQDKIYDIATGEHLQSSPEYFVTNPIEISLGEKDDTPVIDKLFVEWVGEDHKQELYEIIAFALFRKYIIHRIICLIGSGANGKTTFINLMKNFIGKDNITSSSLDLLSTNRFESSKLYKKLLCLMGETNFSTIKRTELIKSLSGEDTIRGEFKGKDPFDFENAAKLIIATNSLPMTLDKTEGYYRRWKIIDFPNRFEKECDILSTIPYEEYQNLARKCLKIAGKLWTKRIFTNDGDFEKRKRVYEEKSNPVMLFVSKNYTKNVNGVVLFSEFYDALIDFLDGNGYRKLTNTVVSKELRNNGFETKTKTLKKEGKSTTARYILGLASSENLSVLTDLTNFSLSPTHIEQSKNTDKTIKTVKNHVNELKEILEIIGINKCIKLSAFKEALALTFKKDHKKIYKELLSNGTIAEIRKDVIQVVRV